MEKNVKIVQFMKERKEMKMRDAEQIFVLQIKYCSQTALARIVHQVQCRMQKAINAYDTLYIILL